MQNSSAHYASPEPYWWRLAMAMKIFQILLRIVVVTQTSRWLHKARQKKKSSDPRSCGARANEGPTAQTVTLVR